MKECSDCHGIPCADFLMTTRTPAIVAVTIGGVKQLEPVCGDRLVRGVPDRQLEV
jgi:hypothetical protein